MSICFLLSSPQPCRELAIYGAQPGKYRLACGKYGGLWQKVVGGVHVGVNEVLRVRGDVHRRAKWCDVLICPGVRR